jgi:acetyl-CoA carboxylase biotin carboxylase subunit
MFRKVLVANRGEIACRVFRACRELGIPTVAVYSQADKDSLHVRLADEAICIGAGSNTDSYLNLANVLMACQISGADAVHPGFGYFSERASFVDALSSIGVQLIGPASGAIEAMGAQAQAPFDHGYATWDALLKKHVRWLPDGKQSRANYKGFAADRTALKELA